MGKRPPWKDPDEASVGADRSVVELHVPISTIVKVLVTAVLVWAVLKLIPEFLFFLLALLFAISVAPLVSRLERRGMRRGLAVALVAILTVGTVVTFVILVGPPLLSQLMTLFERFPEYQHRVESRIAPGHPMVKKVVQQLFAIPASPEVAASLRKPLAWGEAAITGVVGAVLILTLTLYLVSDGKRTYAWLLAYVPRAHRKKMAETIPEVSDVVMAYVQGQALTSFLFGVFSVAVLLIFRVPAAVPLAFLAAVCDIIPVVGLIAATAPAVLLALTVSPVAAASVLALYMLYHLLENTVIIPRVYGRRLRLSTLAVLIALVIGGRLYGILGAILVLPFVAAYPIIERIWLHEYLSDEVVKDHKALEAAAESGSDRAIEKVLKGEKHGAERNESGEKKEDRG